MVRWLLAYYSYRVPKKIARLLMTTASNTRIALAAIPKALLHPSRQQRLQCVKEAVLKQKFASNVLHGTRAEDLADQSSTDSMHFIVT